MSALFGIKRAGSEKGRVEEERERRREELLGNIHVMVPSEELGRLVEGGRVEGRQQVGLGVGVGFI